MSVEEKNKALVRRNFEEWNKRNVTAIGELWATDLVVHRGIGEDLRGREDSKKYVSGVFNAFPDVHFTIDDIVAEGDKVVTRWTMTGTHKGELRGIPPTGKKVTLWGITIYRIAGGKLVEEWERFDTLGYMQQLGVIPAQK